MRTGTMNIRSNVNAFGQVHKGAGDRMEFTPSLGSRLTIDSVIRSVNVARRPLRHGTPKLFMAESDLIGLEYSFVTLACCKPVQIQKIISSGNCDYFNRITDDLHFARNVFSAILRRLYAECNERRRRRKSVSLPEPTPLHFPQRFPQAGERARYAPDLTRILPSHFVHILTFFRGITRQVNSSVRVARDFRSCADRATHARAGTRARAIIQTRREPRCRRCGTASSNNHTIG